MDAPTALPFGRWHDRGWRGAVLAATELLRSEEPRTHAEQFLAMLTVMLRRRLGPAR